MTDKIMTLDGARILYNDLRDRLGNMPSNIETELNKKIDSAKVENGYLVLYANGVPVGDPLGPFNGTGGGGGGGGSATYTTMTMKNTSFKDENGVASTQKTLTPGAPCVISFTWSSVLDDEPTGYGTLTIQVGANVVKVENISQDVEYSSDISEYLPTGQSTVVVTVTDSYGSSRHINYTLNVVAFSLKSTFDYKQYFVEDINYRYIATGTVDKTMHFLIDGNEIGTEIVTLSGRQSSFVIPMQSHGAHTFEVYFTASVNGTAVTSNKLYYDLIFLDKDSSVPIIASDFTTTSVKQFSVLALTYRVYTPGFGTSNVKIEEYLDNRLIHTYNRVDGTKEQTFSYRASDKGAAKIVISTGGVSREFPITVVESDLNLNAKKDHLKLHLNSYGRSNGEALEYRSKWTDEENNISVDLNNFNWSSNGWYVDDDHPYPSLRISSGAYIDIPFMPFKKPESDANTIQSTGYTIEFEYEVFNVDDYDTPIITCLNDKIGFQITAQNAEISSRFATIGSQYKDNEHVRVTFVISPKNADSSYDSNGTRIMYIYLNGVVAGTVQYSESATETFTQPIPQTIRVGSDKAEIDLYNVRIYDTDLSRREVVGNWIADMQDSDLMLEEYARNDIYDSNDGVTIDPLKLPTNLPYIVIKAPQFATSKTDKKIISGYFVDLEDKGRTKDKWKSFSFTGAEMVTQGTSSQAYPIKNFKIKFSKGFNMAETEDGTDPKVWKWSETATKKIAIGSSIKTKTFVFKADFASSEGANNVELVNYYDELSRNIYLTPAQEYNSKARKGINGFPIVMFQDAGDGKLSFVGKYNFNNHKGTDEVYGLSYNGQGYNGDDYSEESTEVAVLGDDESRDTTALAKDYPLVYDYGVTDESWEVTDNNNQITKWKRVAGTGNENLTTYENEIVGFVEAFVDGNSYEGSSETNSSIASAYYHDSKWYEVKQATSYSYSQPITDFREEFIDLTSYRGTTLVNGETVEADRYYFEGFFFEDATHLSKDINFVVTHVDGRTYNGSSPSNSSVQSAVFHEGNWYLKKEATSFEYNYEISDFVRYYTDGAQYAGIADGEEVSGFYHENKFYETKTGSGKVADRAIIGYTLKNQEGESVEYGDYVTGDNFSICKNMIERIRDGECPENIVLDYFENTDFYDSDVTGTGFVQLWRANTTTQDVDTWIEAWKLLEFDIESSSLSSLTTDEKTQRTFILFAVKAMIRTNFQLNATAIYADASEDMLGSYGGGEFAAHAFEVRFPGEWYDAHTEGKPKVYRPSRFLALQEWVVSTDPTQETNELLEKPITYAGVTYTKDNKEYRLAKFKAEMKYFFNVNDSLFYYLYTEMFLMIDSRVKNSFPTYFAVTKRVPVLDSANKHVFDHVPILEEDGSPKLDPITNEPMYTDVYHYKREEVTEKVTWADGRVTDWPVGRWCWFPYDMDTANGIDNEGKLVFSYDLEDIDHIGNATIFNGQDSTLWSNIRKCFMTELTSLYIGLRAGNFNGKEFSVPFSYDEIERRFEEHQHKWPAMVFNDDAYYKYILPLLQRNENRLEMCLGSKEQQRKWWLSNRFNYLDSKYKAGNYNDSNAIQFRAYRPGYVKITPYISMYATVKIGEAFEARERVDANQQMSVSLKQFDPNDTESFLYLADQLKFVEGMGSFDPDTVDISKAVRLQKFDISAEEGSTNEHLETLAVGNNTQLKEIYCDKCVNLGSKQATLNFSGCKNLEIASFKDTKLQSIEFAEGGILKEIYYPSTITSLSLINQEQIDTLEIQGEGTDTFKLKSLNLDNVSETVKERALDFLDIMQDSSQVRLRGFNLEFDTLAEADAFIKRLNRMTGITQENLGNAEFEGTIKINEVVDYAYIEAVQKGKTYNGEQYKGYKEVKFDCVVRKTVKFYNEDGTELLLTKTTDTTSITYTGAEPTKSTIATERYLFHNKWSKTVNGTPTVGVLDNVTTDLNLYCFFDVVPRYTVKFYSFDSEELLDTQVCDAVTEYTPQGGKVTYGGVTPSAGSIDENAVFLGWSTSATLSEIEGILDDISAERVDENNVLNLYAIMEWSITDISIDAQPTKTFYCVGETFDATGLKVFAEKKYLGKIEIFDYTYTTEPLEEDDTVIEIAYKGFTKTVEIGVGYKVEVVTKPTLSIYVLGSSFVPNGTTLKLSYHFGADKEIIEDTLEVGEFTYAPTVPFDMTGIQDITFSYKSLSCTTPIEVIDYIPEDINEADWDVIAKLSREGVAQNYWSVGDKKEVSLVSGVTPQWRGGRYKFRILEFDHNIGFETNGEHSITFGLATDKDEIDEIAFYPLTYSDSSGLPSNSSWNRDSKIRKSLNSLSRDSSDYGFYAALPQELKDVLRKVRKAQGDENWDDSLFNTDTEIEMFFDACLDQEDYIFIPSYTEVFGTAADGTGRPSVQVSYNEAELDENNNPKNTRYEYYSTSDVGRRIKKAYNGSSNVIWALRTGFKGKRRQGASVAVFNIVSVNTLGYPVTTNHTLNSYGVVPCFVV